MIPKIVTPDNATKPTKEFSKADASERAAAGRAAQALLDAFVWDDTAEGSGFWDSVNDRLAQIASDGVLKDSE